jgi:4-hydroxybenzoate polyprenyltransferase
MDNPKLPESTLPLCVRCEYALIRNNLLLEAALKLVKREPWTVLLLAVSLLRGSSRFRWEITRRVVSHANTLPYNQQLIDYVRAEYAAGRSVLLLTTSPDRLAMGIPEHLGISAEICGSTADRILDESAIRDILCARFGIGQFEYVGHATSDLPIWRSAGGAVVVAPSSGLAARLQELSNIRRIFPANGTRVADLVRALRPHQWLKNILLFVPLLVSHQVGDAALVRAAVLAFLCFSVCASFAYVVNDLLDLSSDRLHPRKQLRPFASGDLSIVAGAALAATCLAVTLSMSLLLPPDFRWVLLGYLFVTMSYSLTLKNRAVVDVVVLAGLYTMRIIAGSAATGIRPSFWLLALCMFLFLSLAMVKRYAELLVVVAQSKHDVAGRGYTADDLPLLLGMGTSSGLVAILVLALYVNSPDVRSLYHMPGALWLTVPLMLYWINRVWLKTHRGEMHDDPIVFAASDRPSLIVGACLLAILAIATVGLR